MRGVSPSYWNIHEVTENGTPVTVDLLLTQ